MMPAPASFLQNVHAKLTKLPIVFCGECGILKAYKRRKEVIANMAYRFTGIDVDDMIYGDSDNVISER